MKLTPILILALTALNACYAAYVEIPPADYSKYSLLPSLQAYGVQYVLQKGIESGKLPNNQFTVSSINHIYQNPSATALNYQFDLSLQNANGDRVDMFFTVQYLLKSQRKVIMAHRFSFTRAATNPADEDVEAQQLTQAQINTPLIQQLANFGKDFVVQKAITQRKLSSGIYQVTNIYDVSKRVFLNGNAEYNFDIEFGKSDGTRYVEATFTVRYTKSGVKAMGGYSYHVLPHNA